MISKLSISLFTLLQNEEIVKEQVSELLQAKKVDNLAQLVTLLTIALFIILILLIIYVYKNYKLQKKIRSLESSIKA